MTSLMPILITIVCSIIGAFAQILYKKGAEKLRFSLIGLIKNYVLIAGIFLYGISAILFIFALKHGELSVLYPIVATTYVWVNFLAVKFLNEKMNYYKWTGTIFILIGVFIISVS